MFFRLSRIFMVFSLTIGLFACSDSSVISQSSSVAEVLSQVPADPRMAAGDKIRITVFNEPSLSGEYEIDRSGMIAITLTGPIRFEGLTPRQAETALAGKLRPKYVRDAKVSVEIIAFRPFYVVGEVERQGEFAFRNRLPLIAAIAVAGGQTYRANRQTVYIRHDGEKSEHEVSLSSDLHVRPGDVIRVPERFF